MPKTLSSNRLHLASDDSYGIISFDCILLPCVQFGLIKTRQTRFDEDDPGFPAPGSSAASSQADLSSRGLPNAAPASTSGAPSTVPTAASVQDGARAGAAVQGVALPPPTQPPLQQV